MSSNLAGKRERVLRWIARDEEVEFPPPLPYPMCTNYADSFRWELVTKGVRVAVTIVL